jgi:hypothetical protein
MTPMILYLSKKGWFIKNGWFLSRYHLCFLGIMIPNHPDVEMS